jgi:CheY-like chemotaxis protein
MNTTHFLFGIKILLVEDNAINKALFKTCLNKQGCIFFEASNGIEAIEILKEENVDIIIMDIQMPIMNGIETTKVIRNDLKLETPTIALTSSDDPKIIEEFRSIGMNDYIKKPFNSDNIIDILEKHLTQKQEIVTENNLNGKLYSLHYLIQITHGDKALINEIIALFCEHIPIAIQEIRKAYEEKNIEELKKLIHKIKPNINNFKIEKLYEIILLLNNIDEINDLKSSTIGESISILEKIISEVVTDLNNNKLI